MCLSCLVFILCELIINDDGSVELDKFGLLDSSLTSSGLTNPLLHWEGETNEGKTGIEFSQ